MNSILVRLKSDIRYTEGLNACMNCGICTAICPAAEFFNYDPRTIVTTIQSNDIDKITNLLSSDFIWYCGQCMSCKTRCPRGNCPGQLNSLLRNVSQETGLFIKSRMGRQQYIIKEIIGNNLLEFGYCIHPSRVFPEEHPEQGTVWEWIFENREDVYELLGGNLDMPGAGTLRRLSPETLGEFRKILSETGAIELFDSIEKYSAQKALDYGLVDKDGNADMEAYFQKIYSDS